MVLICINVSNLSDKKCLIMYYCCLIFRYSIILFSTEMSIDVELLGEGFSDIEDEEERRHGPPPLPLSLSPPMHRPRPLSPPRPLLCGLHGSPQPPSASAWSWPRSPQSWSWPWFSTKYKFAVLKSLLCNVIVTLFSYADSQMPCGYEQLLILNNYYIIINIYIYYITHVYFMQHYIILSVFCSYCQYLCSILCLYYIIVPVLYYQSLTIINNYFIEI